MDNKPEQNGFIPFSANWSWSMYVRKAARRYAVRWPVFSVFAPRNGRCGCGNKFCNRPAKHPRTKNGLKDATVVREDIDRMFKNEANVAIKTGKGLMVVDIDPDKDGDITLSNLQAEYGELPDTLTCNTGGGGTHFYFKVDRPIPCSVNKLGPGVDIRADGGYVIAPPSRHMSGGEYEWDDGQPYELAEAPPWLIDLCLTKKQFASPDNVPDAVLVGARNNYLTSIAGAMRRRGMTEKAILAALVTENNARCKPPLDIEEVEKIAKSIAKYEPVQDDGDWAKLLKVDSKGFAKNSAGNAAVYLTCRKEWQGVLCYNEFRDEIFFAGKPPDGFLAPKLGDLVTDETFVYVQHWLAKRCGPMFDKDKTCQAISAVAKQNSIHPVKDFFASLTWDGVERLDTWLLKYCNAKDDGYTARMGKWWLLSAIARIFEPGCQADHMLILEGRQGIGKSSAARIIGGDWYSGSLPPLTNQYAGMMLQGNWIIEVGELDAFKGAGRSRMKDFITQKGDVYKRPYDRVATRRPRQCVFIGTTNEYEYLDDSENRRFWPVRVGTIDLVALARDRNQILAEAIEAYKRGESWWPKPEDAQGLNRIQIARNIGDAWEEKIKAYLKTKKLVTTGDVLFYALGFEPNRIERRHQMRIGDIMRRLGWMPKRVKVDGVSKRVYVPVVSG